MRTQRTIFRNNSLLQHVPFIYPRIRDSRFSRFVITRTRSDTGLSLARPDFLKWVEKGLKIDLSAADVSLEDLGKALRVWSAEEHERLQALRREREQREKEQEGDVGLQDIYTREDG